jgi:hypothetical protein
MVRTAGNRDAWQSGHARSSHAMTQHSSRMCSGRADTHLRVCRRADLRQSDKARPSARGNIGAGTVLGTVFLGRKSQRAVKCDIGRRESIN